MFGRPKYFIVFLAVVFLGVLMFSYMLHAETKYTGPLFERVRKAIVVPLFRKANTRAKLPNYNELFTMKLKPHNYNLPMTRLALPSLAGRTGPVNTNMLSDGAASLRPIHHFRPDIPVTDNDNSRYPLLISFPKVPTEVPDVGQPHKVYPWIFPTPKNQEEDKPNEPDVVPDNQDDVPDITPVPIPAAVWLFGPAAMSLPFIKRRYGGKK